MMLSFVLLAVAQEMQQSAAPRPPPLEALPRCERWKGTAAGNDPSIEVSLRICQVEGQDHGVEGTLLWSSLVSGWNRRELVGSWEGEKLVLRDLRVAEERPQAGWYFCVIDRYELEKVDPGTLIGRYDSAACMDHATLKLERVGAATPWKEAEKGAEKPWYRGCSSAPGVAGWGLWLGMAVVWKRRKSQYRRL